MAGFIQSSFAKCQRQYAEGDSADYVDGGEECFANASSEERGAWVARRECGHSKTEHRRKDVEALKRFRVSPNGRGREHERCGEPGRGFRRDGTLGAPA